MGIFEKLFERLTQREVRRVTDFRSLVRAIATEDKSVTVEEVDQTLVSMGMTPAELQNAVEIYAARAALVAKMKRRTSLIAEAEKINATIDAATKRRNDAVAAADADCDAIVYPALARRDETSAAFQETLDAERRLRASAAPELQQAYAEAEKRHRAASERSAGLQKEFVDTEGWESDFEYAKTHDFKTNAFENAADHKRRRHQLAARELPAAEEAAKAARAAMNAAYAALLEA